MSAIWRCSVFLALAAMAALAQPAFALSLDEARHLLARAGFAAEPDAVFAVAALDRAAAVALLLDGAVGPARTRLPAWVDDNPLPARFRGLDGAAERALARLQAGQIDDLKTWWMAEMLATESPLRERLTLFWHDYFATAAARVGSAQLMLRQNRLLRRHALGNFADLLREMMRDPAMLIWLDNVSNRRRHPNENLARELMELFTLGEGAYTEFDVREAARALSGAAINRATGDYQFNPAEHDAGDKTILGHSGAFGLDQLVDLLLARPETARRVAARLWGLFIAAPPPADELARLAALLRDGGYEMRPVLAEILTSEAFWAPQERGALARDPVHLLVGAARLFAVRVGDAAPLARAAAAMGLDLFDPPNVGGWTAGPVWGEADWINTRAYALRARALRRLAGAGDARALFAAWIATLPVEWRDGAGVAALMLPLAPVDGPDPSTAMAAAGDVEATAALARQWLLDPVFQLY